MITSIEFTNYRAFKYVKATFEPFTVVVGANASGKTSLLRGIDDLLRERGQAQSKWDEVRHGSPAEVVELKCHYGDGVSIATFSKSSAREETNGLGRGKKPSEKLVKPVPAVRYLSLDPKKIAEPSVFEGRPKIADNGGGLAAWLVDTFGRNRDRDVALQESARRVLPHLELISFGASERRGGVGLLFNVRGTKNLTADRMSEGTLLTVALLAVLLDSDGPFVLLLDDIERGLHPRAQRELISVIRSIQGTKPDLQIIATTHSPYLLGELKPEEVRLLSRTPSGESVCRRLDQHPEFERWKDEFDPGELWSFFGEDWEAKTPEEQPAA